MKIKVKAFIHFTKWSFEKKGSFEIYSFRLDDTEYRTYVGEQEVEIDVPKDYNPLAQQIAVLEKEKKQVMADFEKSVARINDRLSKLQALEYTK